MSVVVSQLFGRNFCYDGAFPSNDFLRQYQILHSIKDGGVDKAASWTRLVVVVVIQVTDVLPKRSHPWEPCWPSLDIRLAHGKRPVAGK